MGPSLVLALTGHKISLIRLVNDEWKCVHLPIFFLDLLSPGLVN